MRSFIQRNLDPADRLGEILFGLIVALGSTGAVRLGREEADNYVLVILLATFPVIVPYLVVSNPSLAVRLSNLIALTLLFLLGAWWGRVNGGSPMRIASGLTLLGIALVLVTISLGG